MATSTARAASTCGPESARPDHTAAIDGVYARDEKGVLRFHALGDPTDEEVAQVAAWTYERMVRVFARHGRSLDGADDTPDAWSSEQPVLASLYAASVGDVQILGERPGQRTDKLAVPVRLVETPTEAKAEMGGVNVHAGAAIDGADRDRIEKLIRYMARPPLSQERLERHPDGRLRYRFKAPWKNGATAVLLDPLDFLGRLCALIPPPRFHMIRYHGLLAPNASDRSEVVPGRTPHSGPPSQMPLFPKTDDCPQHPPPPSRHPWAWLLRRVFAIDVLTCSRCHGPMRIVEIATDPHDVARVLAEVGMGPRAPPRPPPTAPGQLPLDLG